MYPGEHEKERVPLGPWPLYAMFAPFRIVGSLHKLTLAVMKKKHQVQGTENPAVGNCARFMS